MSMLRPTAVPLRVLFGCGNDLAALMFRKEAVELEHLASVPLVEGDDIVTEEAYMVECKRIEIDVLVFSFGHFSDRNGIRNQ